MGQAGNYLKRGDTKSFELPAHNRIWKFDETQRVLQENGPNVFADVLLCQTGVSGRNGLPVSKTLRFFATSHAFCSYLVKRFGKCSCEKHASLTDAIYKKTGNYTLRLAKSLIHAVIISRIETLSCCEDLWFAWWIAWQVFVEHLFSWSGP